MQVFRLTEGYTLRKATAEDAEAYFAENYQPLDPEVAFLTGSKPNFSHEEVTTFFRSAAADENRLFLLLISPDGKIVGESVINEWDKEEHTANFRIAIFQKEARGRGLGSQITAITTSLAFSLFSLQSLTLSVFPHNKAAVHVYQKAGFRITGQEDGELLMAIYKE